MKLNEVKEFVKKLHNLSQKEQPLTNCLVRVVRFS